MSFDNKIGVYIPSQSNADSLQQIESTPKKGFLGHFKKIGKNKETATHVSEKNDKKSMSCQFNGKNRSIAKAKASDSEVISPNKQATLREKISQAFENFKTKISELNDKIEDSYQKSNLKKFNDQIGTAFRNLHNYLNHDRITRKEVGSAFKNFFKDIGKAFKLLFSKTPEQTLETARRQVENGHYGDAVNTIKDEITNGLTAFGNRLRGHFNH